MYPLWIKLEYKEFGKQMGYTGSVTSKADLVALMTRLGVQLSEITNFMIDDKTQPFQIIEKLFENTESSDNDGANRRTEKRFL